MRVLLVEDNAYNAFCLRRILESVIPAVRVTLVSNSQAALRIIHIELQDVVILDGDLGAAQGHSEHDGPALADALLHEHPNMPLIAWSDSKPMREAFARIFKQHHKEEHQCSSWPKTISPERVLETWARYLLFPVAALPYQANAGY